MSWGSTNRSRSVYLNGLVTAQSNVPLLRKRIRPEGVRALALRSKLERIHSGAVEEKERATLQSEQTWSIAVALDDENSKLKSELEQAHATIKSLEIQKQDAESAARSLRYTISSLKSERASQPISSDSDITASLLELVCQNEEPCPASCLQLISTIFADRCVVLPSAMESAEEHRDFKQGRRLLLMLRRLVTEYRDAMISGGDGKARKVFPNNEFAAQESESVTSNAAFRKRRVFIYKGVETEMFRHLKIGVNNSPRDMIRVHFAWDSDDKVIVIGHCGQHLPIPSR